RSRATRLDLAAGRHLVLPPPVAGQTVRHLQSLPGRDRRGLRLAHAAQPARAGIPAPGDDRPSEETREARAGTAALTCNARLERRAVVVVHRDLRQIQAFDHPQVHRGDRVALRVVRFAIRVDAAGRAEVVLDDVLVELVRGLGRLGRAQHELVARHEPQQRCAPRAHRTVAGQPAVDLAFDIEGHLAALAASLVVHRTLLPLAFPAGLYTASLDAQCATSSRTMAPSFMMNTTCCSACRSSSGLPRTATRSASLPASIEPMRSSIPISVALVSPAAPIAMSSRALVPCRARSPGS